jgi:hypothetical protein
MMSTERAYPLRVRLEVTAQGGAVLLTPISGHHQPGLVGPKGADTVEKVGNRTAPKISRKSIVGPLPRCAAP